MLAEKLPALARLAAAASDDLFVAEDLKRLGPLVRQAQVLARQYDAVVANPPYMASKYHIPMVKKFLKDNYAGHEKDVFSAFIDRDLALSKPHGRLGFMSPFVWMFISSHEDLRTRLIDEETITTLIQLEYSGFEGATVPICTFTLQKGHVTGQKGCYIRLSRFRGSANQTPKTLEAIRDRKCGWFFEVAQDEFKKIPGSPVAYWVSRTFRELFEKGVLLGQLIDARQGMATADNDRSEFPPAKELTFKNRRFALGNGIKPNAGQKVFTASELGLAGSWDAVFPLGLDRYPRSGSGSRFVHGGTSLQEVVVPVIRLKRERKDESRVVEAELLRVPAKITTGKLSFGLFQLEPVEAKTDGALLCAHRSVLLDSAASEAREREQQVVLGLSNAAGDYDNQILELRLERLLEGVNTPQPYKTVEVKLQRPFGSDFDDL